MDLLNRDVYDQNGRLLLSKNAKLTPQMNDLLAKRGVSLTKQKMTSTHKKFKTHVKQQNFDVLSKAAEVLTHILAEAKKKPWGMYCTILANDNDLLYTHSINVSMLSLMIAEKIDYKDAELWNIGLGALFHDAGKLLVPKSILNKKGPLNDHERLAMQQHCVLGAQLLAGFDLDPVCLTIVRQHHERLDGSGYPDGLTREEIADEAKIVMIADSIDAITSYRPYKKAYPLTEAMTRLANDSDKYEAGLIALTGELFNDQ